LAGEEPFTVSVVICCHDTERIADIREVLASVRRQSVRPNEIVLVVDHNEQLYRELLAQDGITRVFLNARVKGLSATRNVGVSVATSKVVAFIDDDAVAKDGWLSQLLRPFTLDPDVVAVGGKEVPSWMCQRPIWWANELDWVVGGTYAGFQREAGEVRNVHGGNMAFRRSILLLEPFSRSVGHNRNLIGGDETELCLRIRRRFPSSKIWYQPSAVIYHKVPRNRATLEFALRRSYGEGIGKARIRRLHAGTPGLLSPELRFLRCMLFETIPRKALVVGGGAGWFQVGAMIASATAVGLGYLVGLLGRLESEE
jgi:glycosyltransferase involved in cell wall biosynthesis